jgi:O-antigen/teichoic acid export membrane protein
MTLRVALRALIAGGYLIAAPFVAPILIDDPELRIAVYLLAPTILADTIVQGPLQWLRAERRPRLFTVLSFGRAIGAALLAVVAVVALRAGLTGVMVAMAVASVGAALVGTIAMARAGALSFGWDGPLARSMLAFSLPLVPAGLAVWTLNVSDRYVINAFLGPISVGVYALGYTIGMAINVIVVQPFTLAWSAAKWDVARDPAAPGHFARLTRSFAVVGAFAALGLSAFGIDAIRLLLPAGTEAARVIVPFSSFGYVLYGVYSIAATGLMLTNRPRHLLLTMSLAAGANVVMNLALIPSIGIIGAGISTLAGYGLLAASTGVLAHRYLPLPWRWADVIVPLGTGLALAAAAILGPDLLAWRVACVLVYPAVALAGGWVPAPVVGYILRLARRVG